MNPVFNRLFSYLSDYYISNMLKQYSTLEEKNVEEAFRAAHTLKGVAQNLGFTPLYEATATLTEVLRAGNLPEDDNMMNAVAKEYERTVAAIEQLNA